MQDIRRQLGIAIRWLPLILIVTLTTGAMAYMWSSSQDPVYQSTARLLVDPGPEATVQDLDVAESAATNYAELAVTEPVLEAIIERLELDTSPEDLAKRITTDVSPETLQLIIDARSGDPEEARRIAQVLGNEMRTRVRDSIYTGQVKAADNAISANRKSIRTLEFRLNQLRRKQPKTALDRQEIIALTGQISALQRDIQLLQPNSSAFVRNSLEWFDRPTASTAPIEPRPLYWTLLALVAGGMLAAALAFVLEYLRTHGKIRDESDLEAATGLLSVGTVSEMRRDRRAGAPARLLMLRYPHGSAAEAYRGLLSRVGFASGSARSLMVASASDPEAKSAVAANLALAYAEAGRNVILVDADYRSPRLHAFFGLRNDRGLTTVLGNPDVPLGWVTVATSHPRLGLMPAGPLPRESSDPLGAPQLNALLRRLLHAADMVIFDSPSMAGNLDSAVLAANVEESLLVVGKGDSEEQAAEAARVLHAADSDVIGAVLYQLVRRDGGARGAAVVPPPATKGTQAPSMLPRRIPVSVTRADGSANGATPRPAAPGSPASAAQPTQQRPATAPIGGNGKGPAAPSTPDGPYATPYTAPAPSSPGKAPSNS